VIADRLAAFLAAVPKTCRVAVEFRDSSWWTEPVYQVLRDFNAALCIYDLGGMMLPRQVTADFVYFRLRGPKVAYGGSYGDAALRRFVTCAGNGGVPGSMSTAIFDDEEKAFAVLNARRLAELSHQGA